MSTLRLNVQYDGDKEIYEKTHSWLENYGQICFKGEKMLEVVGKSFSKNRHFPKL